LLIGAIIVLFGSVYQINPSSMEDYIKKVKKAFKKTFKNGAKII
jgi:hypothetical protein